MTIKNIESAYEEIYDFLDKTDSHPLSAQISIPVPDLVDGVWVDKYFVCEDVSVGGKHIAYSPEWIFVFRNGEMINQQHIKNDNLPAEYKISSDVDSTRNIIMQYIESYARIKSLNPIDDNNHRNVIDQYLNIFKKIIPKELFSYYTATSVQLSQWLI